MPNRSARSARRRARAAAEPPSFWTAHRGLLLGALAYGVSWPLWDALNLSGLAWGAFVPLLLALREVPTFGGHALRVYGFLGLATFVNGAGWLFGVPLAAMLAAHIAGVVQIGLLGVPLLLLYPLRRWLGFERALLVLIPLWPLWEWASHHAPLSLNTLLLSNSQGANTWLIQYADLFGAWAVTAWVVGFNVVLYRAWLRAKATAKPRARLSLWRAALPGAAAMLLVPLAYAGLRAVQLTPPAKRLRVALISTDNPPYVDGSQRPVQREIERVVHLTDSTHVRQRGPKPDLYAWSEGIMPPYWTTGALRDFLYGAVDDWRTPLLTGAITWVSPDTASAGDTPDADTLRFNQAVLIRPGGDSTRAVPAYSKIEMMPVQEALPGYRYLRRITAMRDYHRRVPS